MVEIYRGWQCIGCGKIEVDGACVGICQDRPVRVVSADDYDVLRQRNELLESVVRRLVWSAPRAGHWEQSFRALQQEAIKLMADVSASEQPRVSQVQSGNTMPS